MPQTWTWLWGLLAMGVAMGSGPCLAHHLAVVVPFVAAERVGFRAGLQDVVFFSLGRLTGYGSWGLLSGTVGRLLLPSPRASAWLAALLGCFLALLGLASVFRGELPRLCLPLRRGWMSPVGRAAYPLGLMVAMMPCPPLLGVLAAGAAAGPGGGLLTGLAFGLGTALSPLLLAAPVVAGLVGRAGRRTDNRMAQILQLAGGLAMIGVGIYLAFGAARALTGLAS